MNFFSKIFASKNTSEEMPNIRFGRFSDSYKTDAKYDAWDRSLADFEQKKYHSSYKLFLEYLKDDATNNVITEEKDGEIYFEMLQGSKRIVGRIANGRIFAEAKIAIVKNTQIGFLRKLVELNFGLKYCRYALDPEQNITIVFNSYFIDGSPYKLYYALKELSTHADKQDDILIKKFDQLEAINTGHIRSISDNEKETKYNFLIEELEDIIHEYDFGKLNKATYPGGISYLLLSAVYKLDYLIKPEGQTMDAFEVIHGSFFKNNGDPITKKNLDIAKKLRKVVKTDLESFSSEVYEVMSTFGITAPTSYEQYASFVEGEIKNMDWYKQNKHPKIALSVPSYIAGYALFSFALPNPCKELLHLYYRITENHYFQKLGFPDAFMKDGKFDTGKIKKELSNIKNKYKEEYPLFVPNYKSLDFSDLVNFAQTYVLMTTKLDMRRAK
jgi:hypothetical protein